MRTAIEVMPQRIEANKEYTCPRMVSMYMMSNLLRRSVFQYKFHKESLSTLACLPASFIAIGSMYFLIIRDNIKMLHPSAQGFVNNACRCGNTTQRY